MKDIYFLSDDETGKLAIAHITGHNIERQVAALAAKHRMNSPESDNLTWGGVSSININI